MEQLKAIVCMGDTTSHGGLVMEGFSDHLINGKQAAGFGHIVNCPQCKGNFPIIEGIETFITQNAKVALDGMQTACGAILIASQHSVLVGAPANTENYDEQAQAIDQSTGQPIANYPFYIETSDGRTFSGYTYQDGRLPRVYTNGADEYTIYWGGEALAKQDGVI